MPAKKSKTVEPWRELAEILGVTEDNWALGYTGDYALDEYTTGGANILCLVDSGWRFVNKLEHLPYAPGIYIIHNGEKGNLNSYLYTGQGYDIARRVRTHPLWQRAIKSYASPIILFWAFNEIQQRELLIFESYMIGKLKPEWNFEKSAKIHRPAPRCPKCSKRVTEPVLNYFNKQKCLTCNYEWVLS